MRFRISRHFSVSHVTSDGAIRQNPSSALLNISNALPLLLRQLIVAQRLIATCTCGSNNRIRVPVLDLSREIIDPVRTHTVICASYNTVISSIPMILRERVEREWKYRNTR